MPWKKVSSGSFYAAILRDARLRPAPQDEVITCGSTLDPHGEEARSAVSNHEARETVCPLRARWSEPAQARVWTITGPAMAVACPANSGARSFSIQASARLLASSACSYLLKMLMAVTVSSGA